MGFWSNVATYFRGDEEDYEEEVPQATGTADPRERIVQHQGGGRTININATAQLQVILQKPNAFSDTKQIADFLNAKKTVILNLESTTPDVTRRIIDFLGGVAYANGGNIKPVSNNTFVITPYNVDFVGDELMSQLEESGVFM
ncbi:MAG: cell division protein SepF [Ruminococcus sp.]|jgi:cell division inhibitor SepF|nr:cell division protein SepF [Ruminococcus sp.]